MSSPLHTPDPAGSHHDDDEPEQRVVTLRPVPDLEPEPPAARTERLRGTGPLSAHLLLEGAGWTPLRVFVDLAMAVLAVVAAVSGAQAVGLDSRGAEALYLLP